MRLRIRRRYTCRCNTYFETYGQLLVHKHVFHTVPKRTKINSVSPIESSVRPEDAYTTILSAPADSSSPESQKRKSLQINIQQTFKCVKCEKTFSIASSHQRHESICLRRCGPRRVHCSICRKSYFSQQQLYQHVHTKHLFLFSCPVRNCGQRCTSQSEMRQHLLHRHSQQRNFACQYPGCDYAAKSRQALERHCGTHGLEIPRYACEYCNYRSPFEYNLKRHVRIHFREKPYQCPYCNFRSYDLSGLHVHVLERKSHETGLKVFPCPWCCQRPLNNASPLSNVTGLAAIATSLAPSVRAGKRQVAWGRIGANSARMMVQHFAQHHRSEMDELQNRGILITIKNVSQFVGIYHREEENAVRMPQQQRQEELIHYPSEKHTKSRRYVSAQLTPVKAMAQSQSQSCSRVDSANVPAQPRQSRRKTLPIRREPPESSCVAGVTVVRRVPNVPTLLPLVDLSQVVAMGATLWSRQRMEQLHAEEHTPWQDFVLEHA